MTLARSITTASCRPIIPLRETPAVKAGKASRAVANTASGRQLNAAFDRITAFRAGCLISCFRDLRIS